MGVIWECVWGDGVKIPRYARNDREVVGMTGGRNGNALYYCFYEVACISHSVLVVGFCERRGLYG